MKRAGDMSPDHLRAVSQHHQRGDGAETAGAQVYRGPVVDLAVDHLVHQPHHVRGEFRNGGRRLRVVVGAVVDHPEFGCCLLQVYFELLLVIHIVVAGFRVVSRVILCRRLIGAHIRVIFVVAFGGHCIHLAGAVAPTPTLL